MTAPTTSTELLALPLENDRRAWLKLDAMAAIIAHFAPDYDTTVRATRTFGYQSARFPDGFGGVTFEPAGTIVCTDDAVSFIQWDVANGVTLDSALTVGRYAIAEVTCAGGVITRINDIRDLGIHALPTLALDDLTDVDIYEPEEDDALRYDATLGLWVNRPMGSVGSLDVENEGVSEETAVTRMNFKGAGVDAVGDGVGGVDVTIPGADNPIFTFRHRLKYLTAIQANNTPAFLGFNQAAAVGTASAPSLGTANFNDTQVKIRQTSTAASNQSAGRVRNGDSTSILTLGNAAGRGGFTLVLRFALVTLPANTRGFFGLTIINPLTGAEPSAATDILGIGWDTSDTTFQVIHNDNAGAATKVDTAITFVVNVVYEVEIEVGSNSSSVSVKLYSVDADGRTLLHSETVTTNLPTNTIFLSPSTSINTGAGTSACAMDFHHWLADTR